MNKTVELERQTQASEELPPPQTHGVEPYISEEYARAERDKLWRKVWLQAGRVEEIPEVGNYLTYDILDDSILIVRSAPDTIKAFYNVCSHRGRRLLDTPPGAHHAHGKQLKFVCGFHGWTYNLEGHCTFIMDKENWQGALDDQRTRLGGIKVDTWGGWIWINIDPNSEPLRNYLEPAASMLDPFELQNMRFRWRRWIIFDCNWKVAMEAFDETYHVPGTHPEFMRFGNFVGWGGRKESIATSAMTRPRGSMRTRRSCGSARARTRANRRRKCSFIRGERSTPTPPRHWSMPRSGWSTSFRKERRPIKC